MTRRFGFAAMAVMMVMPGEAQQVQFGGPVAGLVFDPPSRSLRAVLGIPGAAHMSGPILDETGWASVAPNGRTALVERQGRFTIATVAAAFSQPEMTPILGAEIISSPRLAAWAPDSSVAVLYSASTKSAQWIRFAAPAASADSPVETRIEGEVTAIAVSARLAVLAVAGQGIHRLTPDGSLHPVLAVEDASAIAIDPAGQTLWAADRGQAQILRVANLASAPETAGVVAADPERLSDVSALGLSSSGKQLYAASRNPQRIHVMDISSGSLEAGAQLDAVANSFLPFGRASVMLLGQRSQAGDPLYLFDESSGGSVFFVPAGDSAR